MKRIVLMLFLFVFINTTANAQLLGEWKNLKFYQYGKDTVDYPFDGQNPVMKVMVINGGATNSPSNIALKVTCPQAKGGLLNNFPNGGSLVVLKPGDTTFVSCWVIEIYQNPTTPFQNGEFRTINATFTFETGSMSNRESYNVKRDFVIYYAGQTNTTSLGNTAIKGSIIFPAKPFPNARLTYNTLNWSGSNLTLTPSDSGYTFSGAIGDRGDWYLGFSAEGYQANVTKINRNTAQNIRITPKSSTEKPNLQYDLISTIQTKTGFWRGAVSESEKTFCVFPGQENWSSTGDSALKANALIYKYSFEGQKLWEFAPGWETWGGDMTRDGKYVVYALFTGTGASASYKGPFTIGLLDGLTGKKIWEKTGEKIYESYEVVFSEDGKYIAVGTTGSGQVSLLERETGKTVWSAPIAGELEVGQGFGQVRRMKFDSKGEYVYAGSGDNYLRKIRVSDGKIIWRTFVGAWPFVNGLNISNNEQYIALGMKSAQVAVVRASDGKMLWTYDTGNFDELFFSPDNAYVASYSGKHFAVETGEFLGKSSSPAIGAFTNDSKYVCRFPGEVYLYGVTGIAESFYKSSSGTNIAQKAGEQAQWGYLTNDNKYVVIAARDMSAPPQTGLVLFRAKSSATSVQQRLGSGFDTFEMFPNPAANELTIRLQSASQMETTISIRTLFGTPIIQRTFTNESVLSVDCSALSQGMYVVDCTIGSSTYSRLLVISR